MNTARQPDFLGVITLKPSEEGGRTNVAYSSSYRPQHAIHDNYQTSGRHRYLDQDPLLPGGSSRVEVWLLTPHVYPNCLWPGRKVGIFEGSREVGSIEVTEVINQSLLCAREQFCAEWALPEGLRDA